MKAKHTPEPLNARFWAWINQSWVKLLLRPGETITVRRCRTTEEGWEASAVCWEYDGSVVTRTSDSCGCDCDGMIDRTSVSLCAVDELRCDMIDGISVPNWQKENSWQRDHAAEAADIRG